MSSKKAVLYLFVYFHMITPVTSAITMAKTKLKLFLITVNLVPNAFFSSGNVTMPTIVSVVKNATAGMTLTPADTNVPTSGKAIKAGTNVIVPNAVETNVANSKDFFPIYSAIVSDGRMVRINPIKKMIDRIYPFFLSAFYINSKGTILIKFLYTV